MQLPGGHSHNERETFEIRDTTIVYDPEWERWYVKH